MVGSRVGGSEAAAPSPCTILHAYAKGITYVGSVSNSCAVWVTALSKHHGWQSMLWLAAQQQQHLRPVRDICCIIVQDIQSGIQAKLHVSLRTVWGVEPVVTHQIVANLVQQSVLFKFKQRVLTCVSLAKHMEYTRHNMLSILYGVLWCQKKCNGVYDLLPWVSAIALRWHSLWRSGVPLSAPCNVKG